MDRLYHRILAELLDDVLTGDVPQAGWLPGEQEVAERFACSRGVAREAVRALEERRVVAVRPGHGQQVLPDDRWNLVDRAVVDAILVRHRSLDHLREAVEALRLVETQAAMLAAERARHGDLGLLAGAVERMRAAELEDAFVEAETWFHRTLMLVSGNRFLASMLEALGPALTELRHRHAPQRDPVAIRLHESIVIALRARDRRASAATVEDYARHLESWLGV